MIGLLATKTQTLVFEILELSIVKELGTVMFVDRVRVWEVCKRCVCAGCGI